MARVTLSGASDDLIELAGDIYEEFSYHQEEHGDFIAFSDGTLLRIKFDGVWRITPVVRGTAELTIEQADEDDEGTDTATLVGDVRWAVQGINWAKAKGAPS